MRIAIYMKKNTSIDGIEEILEFVGGPVEQYFIAVDSTEIGPVPFSLFACISFYHLRNYDETILFLNEKDFALRADSTPAKKILVTQKDKLNSLNPRLLDNTVVLFREPNKPIRKAKNAEIRSTVR